ncbi:hypothetical protein PAPYR_8434 [Paratrimastix pyriformis]|uniref:Uncharacterized protein n=1 Tax=Paratrimastix pyriformis TaxID=342808 RepID=A0ABQ8UAJ5_9EUKA|nr:hypothetical protein PAPYR_8434 [Paratrimastix pyriformis]
MVEEMHFDSTTTPVPKNRILISSLLCSRCWLFGCVDDAVGWGQAAFPGVEFILEDRDAKTTDPSDRYIAVSE